MAAGTADYCTMFPEGWWAHCCEQHDKAYELQVPKSEADAALMKCVAGSGPAAPSTVVGVLMFVGVTLFGRRFYRKAKQG